MNRLERLLKEAGDLHILYVEDNPAVRQSTIELLSLYFSHIDTASDGIEGLERYRAFAQQHGDKRYDLVLTDIRMPNCNGIEMIKEIKRENDTQISIVFSAHDESNDLLELINLGITRFVSKPLNIERFETILSDALESLVSRRKEKELKENLARAKKIAEEATEQKSRFLATYLM